MKKMLMAGALALSTYAGAAQAAPYITSPSSGASFQVLSLGVGDGKGYQAAATTALKAAGVTFTGSAGVYSGTKAASAAGNDGYTSPFGANSNANYLAIEPNGSISYTFSTAQTMFGLLFGTIDSYNSITFGSGASAQTFTGTDVMNALGIMSGGNTTRNVLFTGLNPFTTVTLSDMTVSAFEFAPAVAAVPEPAAWGMMILGFGLVGGVLRRRQTAVKVRFA